MGNFTPAIGVFLPTLRNKWSVFALGAQQLECFCPQIGVFFPHSRAPSIFFATVPPTAISEVVTCVFYYWFLTVSLATKTADNNCARERDKDWENSFQGKGEKTRSRNGKGERDGAFHMIHDRGVRAPNAARRDRTPPKRMPETAEALGSYSSNASRSFSWSVMYTNGTQCLLFSLTIRPVSDALLNTTL